uniref:ABC transporter G family member 5 n=1 Tax=Aegilops tauschii subsp. strangulata TaxID=200361 RepID=A0A453IC89_AEGTS
ELGASMPGSTGSESDHTSLTGVGDGTLLPFVLKFTDLTYSVKQRKKGPCLPSLPFRRGDAEPEAPRMKTLLDNISGEAREGEIMAVLGASGSGKSTLIDALANRIRKESLHGSVTLNGESMDNNLLKVISAYVMQDDLLYPMLTVEETLMFSAEFRLPRSLPTKEKKKRVQALIDQLGLRNAANTIIGDEGHRGVSGGERRRVSIGVDIIHDPIVLFLDEPTSGLDSTSAFMVVKVLQRIAQSGSVVVMSIHQPSYRILGLLDRLLFLSRGQTVYYGPPGSLSSFFSDFGKPIHDNENPTEFALDLVRELETMPNGACDLVEHNKSWQKRMGPKMKHADDGNGGKPSLSLQEAISASISRGKLVSGETDVREPVLDRDGGADPSRVPQHEAHAGDLRHPPGRGAHHGVHPGDHLLAPRRLAQGRGGAAGLLRHRHVHHVLHLLRRAARVPQRALHLPPGDGLQRVPAVLVRALPHHRRLPLAHSPLPGLRGHHVLRRGAGRRRRGVLLLRGHRAGLVLGRERVRDVPVGRGDQRAAGVPRGGVDAGLLPALQRLLHQPGQDPQVLAVVPLRVAGQVPVRGGDDQRVQRPRAVLRARGADVRQHAAVRPAGGDQGAGAAGHELLPRHQHRHGDVHHHRAGLPEAAGRHRPHQVGLPLDHRRLGLPLPHPLLHLAAAREQEQEE